MLVSQKKNLGLCGKLQNLSAKFPGSAREKHR